MKTFERKRKLLANLAQAGLVVAVVSVLAIAVMAVGSAGVAEMPVALADSKSAADPIPPKGVDAIGAERAGKSGVAITIPGVPAYLDHHGSGPTAAGMVIGYWDSNGYSNLIPGDASTQTADVNEAIASEGPSSNYTDYCEPRDDGGPVVADLSEDPSVTKHEDNCLADYMKTSQSAYTNWYGHTWFTHVGPALRDYVRQVSGGATFAAVTTNLRAPPFGDLSWDDLRAEIDAGRPLVLLVDMDGNNNTGYVTAVGYDTVGATNYYACYNTQDQELHWYEFALMTPEWTQQWAISDGVTFEIVTLDIHVFFPLIMRNQATQ